MPPVEFEPAVSAGERPKTYALERTATGTGTINFIVPKIQFPLNLITIFKRYVLD
jgi:hypothetical protein